MVVILWRLIARRLSVRFLLESTMYGDLQPTVIEREVANFLINLTRTELVAPDMEQLLVHGPWAELGHFAEISAVLSV